MDLKSLEDKLKKIDEISLLEVLDISSEDIVDRFIDKIEDNFEELSADFEEDDEEFNDD